MKIIHVADYYSIGTGHPLNNTVERLYKRGHRVEVYTSNLHLKQEFGVNKNYPIKINRFRGFRIGSKAFYPSLIPKLLSQQNPDIIHSWVMGFFSTFVSGYIKKLRDYPFVITTDFDTAEPFPKELKKLYVKIYRKLPTGFADAILTFTTEQKKELVKRFGFEDEKVHVLPIGIDLEEFTERPRGNLRKQLGLENKFILLNISFLSPKKNIEMILKALKKLPEKVIFLHAGGVNDADYKERLADMIKKMNLKDRVVFLGKVSRRRALSAYRTADVFIQPGFKESFSIPVLEAMASGKTVITTKTGVAGDVIKNGKTGFIVKNDEEITERIEMLLNDEKLKGVIGKNARKTTEKYDWDIIIDRLEKIYRGMV
jgi:glycosyltransferase involved in cell wall biosynthesis